MPLVEAGEAHKCRAARQRARQHSTQIASGLARLGVALVPGSHLAIIVAGPRTRRPQQPVLRRQISTTKQQTNNSPRDKTGIFPSSSASYCPTQTHPRQSMSTRRQIRQSKALANVSFEFPSRKKENQKREASTCSTTSPITYASLFFDSA